MKRNCSIDYDDIHQAALMGLYKASINYKEFKVTSFSKYASVYIIGAIKGEIRENRLIRLSNNINKVKSLIYKGMAIEDIKKLVNCSDEVINDALIYSDRLMSLNTYDYDNVEWINKIGYVNNSFKNIDKPTDETDKLIYDYTFKYHLTQKEISEILSINQSQVSRRLKRIKSRII